MWAGAGWRTAGLLARQRVHALVTLAHAFLAQARSGGALLNVSSTLVYAPVSNLGVYSATKAIVTSFSGALSRRGLSTRP
ncbi:SDR family NAD(P)-dependent oxidoreductase [Streptomyces sp. NPDC005209]|uniref:SDR family NAD(P)-dependent oxidoreductase n=1 Tax=Streptomyces sp. NPDC005209 TaxID=3156715 RepID=UPI0033AC5FEE